MRAGQDMIGALGAIGQAARLAPDDAEIALGLAQLSYEAGLPAASLFAVAAKLSPERLDIKRSLAIALAADGEKAESEAILVAALAEHSDWIDGHRTLSGMRTTAGQPDFARSFAAAVAASPGNQALWLAWFHTMSTARDWTAAAKILDGAEIALGSRLPVRVARLFLASESGAAQNDPNLFDSVDHVVDPGLDIARVRHFLRGGQVERAAAVAAAHLGTQAIRSFWPYLSLAWRLLGDRRAHWLDGGMARVRLADIGYSPVQLAELAAALRSRLVARAPFFEQSVRGGIQTERPLLLEIDPVIVSVRRRIENAVADYIAALPRHDPAHPLLAPPRDDFRFSGSWAVRLGANGYHAPHSHPAGWISSALYVDVPAADRRGPAPAGHLMFGVTPPELGLGLPIYGDIAPEPGRLALFPSTMWHGTEPFDDGERLTIAFDIVPADPRNTRVH